ncbi:YadA-like family protein [Enterobacter hormaechei]
MKKTIIASVVLSALTASTAVNATSFDEAKARWEAANHALSELKDQHTNQYDNLQFKNGDDIRLFTRIAKDLSAERGQARLEMLGLATPEQLAQLPDAVKADAPVAHPQATPTLQLAPKAPVAAKAPFLHPQATPALPQAEPSIVKEPTLHMLPQATPELPQPQPTFIKAPTPRLDPQATPALLGKTPSIQKAPALDPQPLYTAVPEIAQKTPVLHEPATKAPAMTFDHVSDKWKSLNHSINQLMDTAADRNDPTFQTIIKDLSAQREQARLEMLGLATPEQLAKVPPAPTKAPALNPQPNNATPELAGKTPSIQKAPTAQPQATPELQLTPAIQATVKAPVAQPQATPELAGKTPSIQKAPALDPQPLYTAVPSIEQKTPVLQKPATKAPAMTFDHVSEKWKTINHSINQLVASKADRNDPTFQAIIKDLSAQREQARLEMLGLATPKQLAKVPPVTKAPELNPQPTNATPVLAGKTPSIQKAPTAQPQPQATPELQLTPAIQATAKAPAPQPQATPELQLTPAIQATVKAPVAQPQATPELPGKEPTIQKTPTLRLDPQATPALAGKTPTIQKAPALDPQPLYTAVPSVEQKTPSIQQPQPKAQATPAKQFTMTETVLDKKPAPFSRAAEVPSHATGSVATYVEPNEGAAHAARYGMRPVSNPDTLIKAGQMAHNPLYAGTEIGQKASAKMERLAAVKLDQESRYRERVAHADRFGNTDAQSQSDQPQSTSHASAGIVLAAPAGVVAAQKQGAVQQPADIRSTTLAGVTVGGNTPYDDAQDDKISKNSSNLNRAAVDQVKADNLLNDRINTNYKAFQDGQDDQNKRIDAIGVEAKDNASDIADHDTRIKANADGIKALETKKADKDGVDSEFKAVRQAITDGDDNLKTQLDGKADKSEVQAQDGRISKLEHATPPKDGKDGLNGNDGKDGAPGRDGINGAPGRDGIDGKDGAPGLKGDTGAPGQNGKDGKDGAPGVAGKDGKDGVDGTDGKDADMTKVNKNTSDIAAQKTVVDQNKADIAANVLTINANKSGVATNSQGVSKNASDIAINHDHAETLAKTELTVGKLAVQNNKLISTNQQALTKQAQDFTALQTQVAQKVDTSVFKQRSAVVDQRFADTDARIHQQKLEQDKTNKKVAANSQQLANHEARIQDLESNNQTNFNKLQNQQNKDRKEFRAGVAGAIALTQIPQVQANQAGSFGMAVGTFNGENAIAAGVSSRVTDSVTVKSGLSWDTQGNVGAGAGVSIGW